MRFTGRDLAAHYRSSFHKRRFLAPFLPHIRRKVPEPARVLDRLVNRDVSNCHKRCTDQKIIMPAHSSRSMLADCAFCEDSTYNRFRLFACGNDLTIEGPLKVSSASTEVTVSARDLEVTGYGTPLRLADLSFIDISFRKDSVISSRSASSASRMLMPRNASRTPPCTREARRLSTPPLLAHSACKWAAAEARIVFSSTSSLPSFLSRILHHRVSSPFSSTYMEALSLAELGTMPLSTEETWLLAETS